jgi:hypothetical protein
MEHVIWRQNPEWLFFGGKPKSLDEAHRKYRLGLGYKAGSSEMFVVQLFQKLCAPASRTVLARQENMAANALSHPSDERHFNQWQPLRLMRELEEYLVADAVDLYFDWYRLERVCAEIWTKIMDRLDDVYEENPKQRTHVVNIAHQIFEGAAADEEDAGGLKRATEDTAPELRTVCSIIQEVIQMEDTGHDHPKILCTAKTCLVHLGTRETCPAETCPARDNHQMTRKGEICLTKLADLHPEVTRVFLLPCPGGASAFYRNWNDMLQTSPLFNTQMLTLATAMTHLTSRDGKRFSSIRDQLMIRRRSRGKNLAYVYSLFLRHRIPACLGKPEGLAEWGHGSVDAEIAILLRVLRGYIDKTNMTVEAPDSDSDSDSDDHTNGAPLIHYTHADAHIIHGVPSRFDSAQERFLADLNDETRRSVAASMVTALDPGSREHGETDEEMMEKIILALEQGKVEFRISGSSEQG